MRTKYGFKRKSKYNNKSSQCHQNHWHDSWKEAGYCDQLELLRKAKEIKSYESQVTFDLKVNGQKVCAHIIDFLVTNKYGAYEVHEVKGFATSVWNLKRKLFEAVHPDIEYIVIK